ncbi:MAG: hypothetical protein R3E86_11280 [Pseudomonadales bacterium]
MRGAVLDIWSTRGGGFYGLGYLVTFSILEVRLIVSNMYESDGVVSFFTSEIIDYVLRLGVQSFVNGVLALIWPLLLLDVMDVWALPALLAGYLLFEHLLRARLEAWFPELRAAKLQRRSRGD